MQWEDNIKEKLEKRSIEPSDGSWNTLANRLDAADKKKTKVPFWWMGIAASLIGILFTITLLFKDPLVDPQESVIVDVQKPGVDEIVPTEQASQQESLVKVEQAVGDVKTVESNASEKEVLNNQSIENLPKQQNQIIAKTENIKVFEPIEMNPVNEIFEDKKVSEIVAQINDLKSKGQTVTDADIDALLHKAQKEIAYQSILKESVMTVDANDLLRDVEMDLQQSFRDKIFEAIKNSYETVKTAVAERKN